MIKRLITGCCFGILLILPVYSTVAQTAGSFSTVTITGTQNSFNKGGGGSASYGWGEDINNNLDPRPNAIGTRAFLINHHTGLTFSAHSQYGGIRFFNQGYPDLWGAATLVMSISNGRVGIGTPAAAAALDVRGSIVIENSGNAGIFTGTGTTELSRFLQVFNSTGLSTPGGLKAGGMLVSDTYTYANPSKNDLIVKGNIGIGTATPKEKLSVNGGIRARTVKVEEANWPDYVFEKRYALMPLTELETFIDSNKHLPEVPSAAEVASNGQDLGQINKLLLQKVEELTLYIIDLQKQVNRLKEINTASYK